MMNATKLESTDCQIAGYVDGFWISGWWFDKLTTNIK